MKKRIASSLLLLSLAAVSVAQQQASIIREIVIRGNQRVSQQAIEAAMRTKAGQPYLQENLDADRASIEALGFFSAVDVRAVPLEGGNWQVLVNVVEFPEIKEIRVTGNTVVSTAEILRALTLQPGQVFNISSLRPSAEAVRALYNRKGFDVTITAFEPLAESPGTVDLQLIETRVNSVSVQGNTRTRDYVMRRLIKTRAGEVLNVQKWSNDLRRLFNTQWFEDVDSIEEVVDVGRIDLTAAVKETRTGIFNIGLQVDPRNSVAGVLRLQESNLRGTGQSVGINFLQATAGGGASIDLDYANPFIDNRDTTLRVSAYSRVLYRFAGTLFAGGGQAPADNDRYIERRTGASIGLARPIRDNLTVGVTGRYEGVKTEDFKVKIDPGTGAVQPFLRQDGEVGVVTLGATLNRRDTDIDPSRGDWLRVELEPGFARINQAGPIGMQPGTSTFLRGVAEYRRYFTDQPPRGRDLNAPRRVLALRLRYGAIAGTVPFFEQFFAGGSDTVRGYLEDRFWGKQQLLSTVEYRYPIQQALNVIAFVDYGGAWGGYGSIGDFRQSDRASLHLGYGLGLSFRTPLGPIRLDLGFDENGKSRTHFLIGTSF